ncbi:MAG: hypothetical protein ACJ71W_05840 [Terriglobales bacterium]
MATRRQFPLHHPLNSSPEDQRYEAENFQLNRSAYENARRQYPIGFAERMLLAETLLARLARVTDPSGWAAYLQEALETVESTGQRYDPWGAR